MLKKTIKKILNRVIDVAISIGVTPISKIKNKVLQSLALFFVQAGQAVANVYLDDNPNNEEQLKQVVRIQAGIAIEKAALLASTRVEDFKDAKLKSAIIEYLGGVTELLKLLIDDNPDNEAQAKLLFDDRKADIFKVSLDLISSKLEDLITNKGVDPIVAALLPEIIQIIMEALTDKD